jgi:hypothetical protein
MIIARLSYCSTLFGSDLLVLPEDVVIVMMCIIVLDLWSVILGQGQTTSPALHLSTRTCRHPLCIACLQYTYYMYVLFHLTNHKSQTEILLSPFEIWLIITQIRIKYG